MYNPPVLSRQQSRALDRLAMDKYQMPGIILMENAGKGCAAIILELLKGIEEPAVTILTGKGNNGGDGFVVARHLSNAGVFVTILGTELGSSVPELLGKKSDSTRARGILTEKGSMHRKQVAEKLGIPEPERKMTDAEINLRIVRQLQIPMLTVTRDVELSSIKNFLKQADLVVDALLGTGAMGPPREPYGSIIAQVNQSGKTVVAVDLPSGLNPDTGEGPPSCVRAAHTVTFAAPKKGFYLKHGPEICGEIHVVDISVPKAVFEFLPPGDSE